MAINEKKVSIITVVKNCEKTVEATIKSVNRQTYRNVEHIVIDGMSKDNTLRILKLYRDYLAALISEPDVGIYDAMNKGLRIASGDIIGFLNADDIFAGPDIVKDVVQLMENSGKDAIFGDLVYVSPKNPEKIVRYYDSSGFKEKWLSMGSMPAHPTLYLNRNVYDKFGNYRTDYKIAADFEFITRIFHNNHNSYAYLPKIMVRMNMGGISTRNLYSNYVLNKEMLRACRENNISTNILKLLLKYPKKFAGVIKARKMQSVR